MSGETIQDAIERALDAYLVLAELGEGIEDEWSYVNDLSDAWRTRFDEVVARQGADQASDEASADLLTQRMQLHEKTAWMLRSLLED